MKVEVAGKMVEIPDDYDPRKTDEEYMCENHRAFFKKKLLDWKDEITSKLFADISGEDMDRRSTDESDNMSAEMQTLQELRQKDRLRKLMIKIEENINKIDQDTYGFCEETGNEIGINRLIMIIKNFTVYLSYLSVLLSLFVFVLSGTISYSSPVSLSTTISVSTSTF